MANRRAGLIEAPADNVIQTPNLASATSPLVAQAYDDLARTANKIGQLVQPLADRATEERATKKVAEGDFSRTAGITRQDEIYDKVIDAGFMSKGANDVDGFIAKLENDNLATLDVEKFAKENGAARAAYLEGIDTRYAVPLGQLWDKQASTASQRITGLATQKAVSNAVESLKARETLLRDRVSGASDPNDPEVAGVLAELNSVMVARASMPQGGITPADVEQINANTLSRMEANRISDEAMALFEAGGRSDAAYAQAATMLDEAISSPALALPRTERASYFGSAKSALNAARSEARREDRELERSLREAEQRAAAAFSVDYTDAMLRTNEGYAPSTEEIIDLYKQAHASGNPRYVAKVDRIAATAQVQSEMRGYSVPEQDAYVSSLQVLAANGDNLAAAALDPARKVAAATRSAAGNDPATYAAVREGRKPPAIDWENPANTIPTMTSRFNEAEGAAKDLGVPTKYFAPADAKQLREVADRGGVNALGMATSIVDAAEKAGIDPMRPLQEVAGSGAPLLATAGALVAQGVPEDVAARIMAGVEVMKTDVVKNAMPSQATQASAQRKVLGSQMASMSPEALDALTRSADAHYAATIVANGGTKDASASKSYEASLRAVTGEWLDSSGKAWGGPAKISGDYTARAPSWMKQKTFPIIVKSLTDADIASAGGPGMIGSRAATAADYRSGYPVDAGAGLYYYATERPKNGRPAKLIVGGDGKPILLDLNRIRDTLKVRQPDAVR